jgi:O-methyltransferase
MTRLDRHGIALMTRRWAHEAAVRAEGRDWPQDGETMIGLRRLDNLDDCIRAVLRDDVPGDLIETGTWRGGAAIFMRAALTVYGDRERLVWVADSFRGLPRPDPRFPADAGDTLWTLPELAVPLDTVKQNFARYGLLDDRVRFLVGWFKDILPTAPMDRLALLRLDGDLYESTTEALNALYPKLSPGGFLIVDDWAYPPCRQAVEDYRAAHGITEPIEPIDWSGVFWRKK